VLNFGDETQVIKTEPRIRNGGREREGVSESESETEENVC